MKENLKERLAVSLTIGELESLIANYIYKGEEQKKQSEIDDLISFQEVCQIFGVSKTSIHKWRRLGILPKAIKVGGRVYFKKDEISQMLNSKSGENEK